MEVARRKPPILGSQGARLGAIDASFSLGSAAARLPFFACGLVGAAFAPKIAGPQVSGRAPDLSCIHQQASRYVRLHPTLYFR